MNKGHTILIAEDDPNDVFFLKISFRDSGISNPVQFVSDGEEAIAYLEGTGSFADRRLHPLPGLVLLDLKMPRKSGFEVISWMRHHSAFKLIPIIVLSGSAIVEDVNRAYEMGVNAYMIKPASNLALERLVRTIAEFWGAAHRPLPNAQ
ncbi:MAG: response regulator [Verrucomicrobia subdivision 3 bacterium]|nr:response regulator [Limisphaerales bacterium]